MGKIWGKTTVGEGTFVADSVILGHPGKAEGRLLTERRLEEVEGATIGANCVLRDFGIIYSRCALGDRVQTGHHYLVREDTTIGSGSLVGSGVIVEDNCRIGEGVSMQSGVYVPTHTIIEDGAFLGPNCTLTNDKFMGLNDDPLTGPVIGKGARLGANSTVLPGVKVGAGAVIGSGTVVVCDVEPGMVVVGVPGKVIKSVEELEL